MAARARFIGSLTMVMLMWLQPGNSISHRPPSVPLGAEWLNTMPTGGEFHPPAGQPVLEVNFKNCKPGANVVEYLYAEIRPQNLGRGTDTNAAIRTYVKSIGKPNDDAGHVIGKNQGGLGTVQWNIFPQNGNFNRGVFAQNVEKLVNSAVTQNGLVRAWFRFVYGNGKLPCRPTKFEYYLLSNSFANGNDLANP